MRLLPLALGVLWPAIAIAGASEEELDIPQVGTFRVMGPTEEELVAIIVHTPRLPEAENSVQLLISDLHEQERFVELRAWVDRLADDPVITFRRPELAEQLRQLQLQFQRKDAEETERQAWRASTQFAFDSCVDRYGALRVRLERAPELRDSYWRRGQLEEVRYNEAVCAEHAGHPMHAMARYAEVTEGSLGGYARARLVRLLGALPQIGFARAIGAPLAKVEMPRKAYQDDFADDVID